MTRGEKFSTTTSEHAARRSMISLASGRPKSMVTERLFLFHEAK